MDNEMDQEQYTEILRDEEEFSCGKPCHPNRACDQCAGYWEQMINDGMWDKERGMWTDKGWREVLKG